jgi:hypothetical protein
LSEYRQPDQAVNVQFGFTPQFTFHDNFMTIAVDAESAKVASKATQAYAELVAKGLSVQYGLRVTAEFQSLEDEVGVPQRVPRSIQLSFGVTWYNLAEMHERLGTVVDWALAADDRSRKALLYFEHSCLLAEFARSLSLVTPHAGFSYALAFLQMYKGLVLIVGEPGTDRDYQSRAVDLGLAPDFWSTRVKPLYKIRNDEDVAHHSLEHVDLKAFLDLFRQAADVFREAFTAYCRSRANVLPN